MTKKVYSDILKMAGAILGVFLYAAAYWKKYFILHFLQELILPVFFSGYSIFRFSFLPGKQSAAHFS